MLTFLSYVWVVMECDLGIYVLSGLFLYSASQSHEVSSFAPPWPSAMTVQ